MSTISERRKGINEEANHIYQPQLFRLNNTADREKLESLLKTGPHIDVLDHLNDQLKELIKIRNPAARLTEEDYEQHIARQLGDTDADSYGVWVYYPWAHRVVHLLDEAEFVEVRTSRNKYKITTAEQQLLMQKKIGIIGLSVGQSIAITSVMERVCGELRLADFDTAELSNLNRIRTGVHNLGVLKVVLAAREIAEIDPFMQVKIFSQGLTDENMEAFFTEGGKLDMLVEVCDGLDMKIASRLKAREKGIPVVMDTNDRGMLDVERFDLEPERPLLHGLAGDLDAAALKNLTNEERILLVLQIAGSEKVSARGKASLVEIGQTITTWPQLASSVAIGGGATTDTVRRIFLGQFRSSGRYYIDMDQLLQDEKAEPGEPYPNPYHEMAAEERNTIIAKTLPAFAGAERVTVPDGQLKEMVKAATAAPTTGNDQPWYWDYKDGVLFLFHDRIRSYSFGDYRYISSYLSFGAAMENLELAAGAAGFSVTEKKFAPEDAPLIAAFYFNAAGKNAPHPQPELVGRIYTRHTNRVITPRQEPDENMLQELKQVTETVPGAQLTWVTDQATINKLGGIIGACDRMRILNPRGHYDFVHREMRWTPEDAEMRKDGIDIRTLGLSAGQLAALSVIKSRDVIDLLRDIKGARLLEMATRQSVATAAAIGLITMPGNNMGDYLEGGRALERMWLAADKMGWAIHPVISPIYLFSRLDSGDGLSAEEIATLHQLRQEFLALYHTSAGLGEMFLFKIFKAEKPDLLSIRRLVETVLTIH